MYQFGDYYIPDHMIGGITRYIENGILPGDFLQAVLSNDFAEAVARADEENLDNLPAYMGYLYNEVPRACWGSRESVKAWIARGGLEGIKKSAASA